MLFNQYDPFRQPSTANRPGLAYEVVSAEDGVTLSIDIPGIDPADVDLTVDGRSLKLTANRPNSFPENAKVVTRGRRNGQVTQSFQLGEQLDADGLAADYAYGVLTVTIPVAESAKPRKVAVGVGAVAAIDAEASEATAAPEAEAEA